MLDPKLLRQNLAAVVATLAKRGYQFPSEKFEKLESNRKQIQTLTQELQNQRNQLSKAIGLAKSRQESALEFMKQAEQVNEGLQTHEKQLQQIQTELQQIYDFVPNLPHESVPEGRGEQDNQEIRRWGEPKKFAYSALDHVALGEALEQMDFNLAAKLSGARFVVLRNGLAKLHRALGQFMLDTHTQKHGYTEMYVPYLVHGETMYATGQLPNMAEDTFHTQNEAPLYLIPTAEVSLTNLARDKVFESHELPIALTAHTPCFRAEAGSYGKDTRGMIRQHQFEKVELVHLVQPEQSYSTLDKLVGHAEAILQALELPYRVMLLCTKDIGFNSAKTYDLEVWLPGQNCYREISSCSNCEDFQARRLQARWRSSPQAKPELIHTLNGSGLAIGRTLVAIMENYQDERGRIHIPTVLRPYMSGLSVLGSE